MRQIIAISTLILCSTFVCAKAEIVMEAKIDSILNTLSIADKIGQTNQLDGRGTIEELKVLIGEGKIGSVMNVTDPVVVNELQRVAVEESPAGIPLVFTRDVVHGFKTMFPIPLGQAATFNRELIEEAAHISAIEATEHGIKWAFAPMIDIARDPRWGRVAEGYGEDTYLTEQMAVAVVKGYQGNKLSDPNSMAACVKHFVGYGAAEGGRDYNSTSITERQLREIYMPPFKRAFEVGCASVMSSFNSNDGTPVTANQYLLRTILRDEWGFDGVTLSDWGSVSDLIKHGVAKDRTEAAIMGLEAGIDMEMSSKTYIQNIEKLIAQGDLSEGLVDGAVRNILRLKYRLGLFEQPYTEIKQQLQTYSDYHLEIAQKVAEQSIVLLKNSNKTLPISGERKKILVVGPLADAPHDQLGTWTMDGEIEATITPIAALREAWADKHDIQFIATLGYSRDDNISEFKRVSKAAKRADLILAFVGEEAILSGEAHSLADIGLKGAQSQLIELLSESQTPLVTILMAGRPLTIEREVELSDAVLYAWHPGTMGGYAICNTIFGTCNPSGKLPMTFPRHVGQIPIYYNHEKTGRQATGKEATLEQIPVNARQSVLGHASYYLDYGSKPLFPFGYGLSYSEFEISNLTLSKSKLSKDESLVISVEVHNIGEFDGEQVIQLYTTDLMASIVPMVRELKDFRRIWLKSGERQKIEFNLPISRLSFVGRDMKEVVESGEFIVTVGQDSQGGLQQKFSVK